MSCQAVSRQTDRPIETDRPTAEDAPGDMYLFPELKSGNTTFSGMHTTSDYTQAVGLITLWESYREMMNTAAVDARQRTAWTLRREWSC